MLELHGWYIKRLYHGGGKGGSAPPPPDYRGAAIEQGAASKELAQQQTFANRPSLNTPWGQMTWQAGAATDPSTGAPVTNWTGNLSLTPGQQDTLDAQQRIQQGRSFGAETLLPQAVGNFQQEFNWRDLPGRVNQAADPGNVQNAQMRSYDIMSQMLQPERRQAQADLETRLANMGFARNSEGWGREMSGLAMRNTQQDKAMMAQALAEGRADIGQQFGMDTQAINQQQQLRQQAIAEEAQRRGMTLNELNALLTQQQVNMPTMPTFQSATAGQAPNLLGAAQATGNYNLQNSQQGGADIGGLLGAGLGAYGSYAGAAGLMF